MMQGGNISNESTPRMWVVEDVVLSREPVLAVEQPKKRWFRKPLPNGEQQEAIVALPAPVSVLWRMMRRREASGLRLELVHIGTEGRGQDLLSLLDRITSSPFSDVVEFPNRVALVDALAFRPDVIGVVDLDDRFMAFGGRGMALRDVG